jgi:hypothetical protein
VHASGLAAGVQLSQALLRRTAAEMLERKTLWLSLTPLIHRRELSYSLSQTIEFFAYRTLSTLWLTIYKQQF